MIILDFFGLFYKGKIDILIKKINIFINFFQNINFLFIKCKNIKKIIFFLIFIYHYLSFIFKITKITGKYQIKK